MEGVPAVETTPRTDRPRDPGRRSKRSRSRAIVIEGFFRARDHVTIEQLTHSVREGAPGIGAVTVYRTLKLLERLGYAKELDFGEGARRYEKQPVPAPRSPCLPAVRNGHRVRGQGDREPPGPRDPAARVSSDCAPSGNLRLLQEMRVRPLAGECPMSLRGPPRNRWAP